MTKSQQKSTRGVKTANAKPSDPAQAISDEAKSRQPESIVRFFRESPCMGLELDLERDQDAGREIAL